MQLENDFLHKVGDIFVIKASHIARPSKIILFKCKINLFQGICLNEVKFSNGRPQLVLMLDFASKEKKKSFVISKL